MLRPTFLVIGLLAGSACFTQPAFAQLGPRGLPSPEVIANADKFDAPTLTEYGAKLTAQTDFMGQWAPMEPKSAGAGPTWDPVHTYYTPSQPLKGESGFGPIPGTKIQGIPYNAEWAKKYDDLIKETIEGKSRDDFPACFPYGVPRMIGDTPVPFDVIQSPEVMLWYNFYGRTERRIFMDGRPHPKAVGLSDDARTYSGHSVGHWEGKTLVIDTANMMEGYFDETPAPHSDQVHLVERLRLIDTNIMEDQITVTDPVAMTGPWVVTRYFQRGAPFGGAPPPDGPGGPPAGAMPPGGMPPGAMPPGGMPPGAMPPGAMPPGGMPPGAMPPGAMPPQGGAIKHFYFDLSDQQCVPNVKMVDGFQVAVLPQELNHPPTAKPKAKPKASKKIGSKETHS